MKTTMKQLTAGTIIVLLLLAGNTYAKGTKVKASSHENIETSLQIEKWMTNEVIWNSATETISTINQVPESVLELEIWMTSTKTWNLNDRFKQEIETGLEIETWMTSIKTWNVEKTDAETELAVENWMMNNSFWN
ncbi:MAG: hypothetical protein FD181_2726 [Prolixibacteraceae bacterium]|nr:MAG: hypothetical protein FD181_2726 [Prolixibacteraceae bacterium]